MSNAKITEQPSRYRHLEQMSTEEIVQHINDEDQTVALAVQQQLPHIARLADAVASQLKNGGRLFYIGAGTSGRLGVLDASECPPTYGVDATLVNGVMAGGDAALRFGIEDAEDSYETGWQDLLAYAISSRDIVIGIAASGTTPYVVGALEACRKTGIPTGCIVCNPASPVAAHADYPVEVIVGPEFVTGSTRMKSGTAQKMVLNMISTAAMIRIGRVKDNRMVHMQISNDKLTDRGTLMLMQESGLANYEEARALLLKYGSVQAALDHLNN
ncbi:N-acetylmuramic acid 6-phosphate etherase [Nostoc ellipsosporum NOK]|nr:N-acetylmuramic acid 6-phosphate etherase [Nostoc ellipsosporum NOK]